MQIISHGEYGLSWPKGSSKFKSELLLYVNDELRESSPKALTKAQHFENAIKLMIPDKYLVWHKWLHRAIESWCYDPIASEWGASGMGKSSDYGLIALFDVLADPSNTLTVIVTNPLEMHWERCFKYANMYYSLLPKDCQWLSLKKQNPLGLLYDHEKISKATGTQEAQRRTGIICFSNKPGDSFEDLKRRIGAHEKRMRLFVDEPQGCSGAVLKLKINMSAGAGVDYRERFLGNPSGRTDPLGQHSAPRDNDWKKTEYLDEWETDREHKGKSGKCFVRDGRKSPANEDPQKFFFMFGPDDLKDAKQNYGEDSQEMWTYAYGRLKGEGATNIAISEADLQSLDCYRDVIWDSGWTDYAGLDAASEGRDGNALYRVRCGREVDGQIVAALVDRYEIQIKLSDGDNSGQIAKQVVAKLNSWNVPIDRLAGDITGNQGPIFDRIEAEAKQNKRCYRVQASGYCSSDNVIFRGSNIRRKDRYFNRASELFYNVVVAAQKKQLILKLQSSGDNDTEVTHQLTTRRIDDDSEKSKGKIKLEKKELWRARNNGESPDNLDAVQQVMALLVEKGILPLNEGGQAQTGNEGRPRDQRGHIKRRNRRTRLLRRR